MTRKRVWMFGDELGWTKQRGHIGKPRDNILDALGGSKEPLYHLYLYEGDKLIAVRYLHSLLTEFGDEEHPSYTTYWNIHRNSKKSKAFEQRVMALFYGGENEAR